MHSKKVIRGDLKPDNILVTLDDEIKITDFALTTTTKSSLERYRSGDTSLYDIAPQLKSKNNHSRNEDMLQFGVILLEMCFNPFQSGERNNLLKMMLQEEPLPIPIPDKYKHHRSYPMFMEVIFSVIVHTPQNVIGIIRLLF